MTRSGPPHLSIEEASRMRLAADVYTRRSVLGGGVKVAGGLVAAGPLAALVAACGGDDDNGEATGTGPIREIGLSLTEDPRILGAFQEETGIRVDGRSEGLGDLITFWRTNYETFDTYQLNYNQLGAIQDTLRTIPVDEVPAWNDDVDPLFREPGVPGYNEESGWPIAGIYTQESIDNETYDEMLAVPTWYGFDAFGYLEGAGGDLDSYGAIFDPENEGRATLLDEPITTIMKAATFLSGTGQASFQGPINNLTTDDLDTVFEFLDEQKGRGQFRLFWNDFGQLVDLLVAGEVVVGDFWASAVANAVEQGADAHFVNNPTEGSNGWIHGIAVSEETNVYDEVLEFINWSLESGVVGEVLGLQGYYTPRPDVVQPRLEVSNETHPDHNDWEYWWQGAEPDERPALEDRLPNIADWQAFPDEFEEYSRRWTQFVAA